MIGQLNGNQYDTKVKIHVFHKWKPYTDVGSYMQERYCSVCNRNQLKLIKGARHVS